MKIEDLKIDEIYIYNLDTSVNPLRLLDIDNNYAYFQPLRDSNYNHRDIYDWQFRTSQNGIKGMNLLHAVIEIEERFYPLIVEVKNMVI